jgi:hypothetical protein
MSQGYRGNLKIGFHYAINNGLDIVALIHGDAQYAPDCLPDLQQPLLASEVDAVLGSRTMTPLEALSRPCLSTSLPGIKS